MSNNGVCSIKSCDNPVHTRRLCNTHYRRLRRTGTTRLLNTGKGEAIEYLFDALKHKNKRECLVWPYARSQDGYARVRYKGKLRIASRLVCTLVHGKPRLGQEARHSCGKGHEGCINLHHLHWATPKENAADKILHGTKLFGEGIAQAVLRETDVVSICRLLDSGYTHKRLSIKFNVSRETISGIARGDTWKHVTQHQKQLGVKDAAHTQGNLRKSSPADNGKPRRRSEVRNKRR